MCRTHSLRTQPGPDTASLRYTAPSSSIRLYDRSMTSRVGFCVSTLARRRTPSRVTRLLQDNRDQMKYSPSIQRIRGISQRNTSGQSLCDVEDVLFLPAQVQVAQAVVEQQAFSQPLHPGVGHPHLPQVELHQAAVQHQHL